MGYTPGLVPIHTIWGMRPVSLPGLDHTKNCLGTTLKKGSTMTESTNETPVLDLLARMTADSIAASSLNTETLMLVRIAALAAVDAPPVSYLLNLEAASEIGIDPERVRGVLAAIAPIVGTARVASATGKIVEALAVEIEIAELEEESDEV